MSFLPVNLRRLGCALIVLLALWQLVAGIRSLHASGLAAPRAATASAPRPADSPAPATWNTTGSSSFAAQAPLSPGLSPLALPGPADPSDWERRLSDARSEQLRLQAVPGLTPRQREAALQAHLQQHFSAAERARVEVGLQLLSR